MKLILFVAVILTLQSSIAQDELPPPAAMAPKENEPIIDSLVEIMDYGLIFDELKKEVIKDFSVDYRLDVQFKELAFNEIQFDERPNMFYNVYGLQSKEELEVLITEFIAYTDEDKIRLIHKYDRIALSNYRNYIRHECEKLMESDE